MQVICSAGYTWMTLKKIINNQVFIFYCNKPLKFFGTTTYFSTNIIEIGKTDIEITE